MADTPREARPPPHRLLGALPGPPPDGCRSIGGSTPALRQGNLGAASQRCKSLCERIVAVR
eukprot:12429541-Alexandrium_andersonii.AAC.1